jgi:death-on-curing protein
VNAPNWLEIEALVQLHLIGLKRYGGPAGLRDAGLLASALERPRNRWAYEGVTDLGVLAATYGVAIIRNHAFVDGNKRMGFLATVLFLRRNGRDLVATSPEAVDAVVKVAARDWELEQFEAWVVAHTRAWRG